MKSPQVYKNKSGNRLTSLYNDRAGAPFLAENEYKSTRNQLAKIRKENPTSFKIAVKMSQAENIYQDPKKDLTTEEQAFLEKHGIGFSGQTLSVLKDWNENGQLGASYEPSYMLDVAGHPMDRSIWMAVSKQVEQFIDRNPQWKTQLLNINGGTVPQTVERLMTQDKDGMHVTMGQELKDNGLTQNNGTIKINAQAVIKHAKRTM